MKCFIVDDHPLMREGLRMSVANSSIDCEVVGDAGDVDSAFQGILKTNPEVIILDHCLQDKTGLDLIQALKPLKPDLKFILITETRDKAALQDYMKNGVNVLTSKINSQEELQEALNLLRQGKPFLCSTLQKVMDSSELSTNLLTSRELEVLRYIATGKSNKAVAAILSCSDHTVKSHKTNIMRKLNFSTSVEISVWAIKNNIK